MSERTIAAQNPPLPTPPQRTAQLGYLLFALGLLFGVTAIIGMLINHVKLADTRGTLHYPHLLFQLASFWLVTLLLIIGYVVWPATFSDPATLGALLGWAACWIGGGLRLWTQTRHR